MNPGVFIEKLNVSRRALAHSCLRRQKPWASALPLTNNRNTVQRRVFLTLLAEQHHLLRVLCASVFQIQSLLVFSHRLFDFDFWKHRVTEFTEEN